MTQPRTKVDMTEADVDDPIELDGRRQRRDRNRNAVVDAMLDLHTEGKLSPSVAEIADRSGVSHRSVFRYFDDLEDLTRVAITRANERYQHLGAIPRMGEGTLSERVDRLVEQRLNFYQAAGSTGRAGRLKAPFQKLVQDDLTSQRGYLKDGLRSHFAHELDRMPSHISAATLTSIDIMTSLESYDLLVHEGLSRAKMAGVLRSALLKLLS